MTLVTSDYVNRGLTYNFDEKHYLLCVSLSVGKKLMDCDKQYLIQILESWFGFVFKDISLELTHQ
jgi:hypothetical protein